MKRDHPDTTLAAAIRLRLSAGFSMIELLVAMTILAVLLGFGLPSVRDWIENRHVTALAEGLSSALRTAQSEAIQRNTLVELAVVTSAVVPAPANPTAATMTVGGLAKADPTINLLVRVRGVTVPPSAGYIQGMDAAEGSTNARMSGPAGVVFNALGRAQNTLDDSNALVAPADPIVFQIANPNLTGNVAKRRCVFLPPGGAVKICDPKMPSGDPRACQPVLTVAQCPSS